MDFKCVHAFYLNEVATCRLVSSHWLTESISIQYLELKQQLELKWQKT